MREGGGKMWLGSRLGVRTIPNFWLGVAGGTGVLNPTCLHQNPTEDG